MKRFMKNTIAVIKRELAGYFGSPVAYVFIVIFLLLCGFFTFSVSHFYELGQADLRAFFEWHPWIFLFLIPAVAMRLWADEWRTGTIELMLTLPITLTEVVVGKFLAAWLFIAIGLFLTFPLVLTVIYLGDPDLGAIFCAYFGSFFMAGAYLSVGSMTSSLTRNQVISFILSLVFCLFLVLAGWSPVIDVISGWAPAWIVDIVSGFSFMPHFASIQRGVLDLRDLAYYLSVIFFMLFANGVILLNRRAS
jgi:ABC-2 type transport system permease protein